MELLSIASGSSGNCYYVGNEETHLLVDAGVSGKKIETALNEIDRKPSDLDGILVTHEHIDHVKGLGVMARKNDIKYHVTEDMVRELAAIQKTILDVCAVYVKPGGALIYSTCTIDRIENEENVTAFLKAHEEYELESLSDYMPECLKKRAEKGYITLLQGVDHCDGFFISRLRRRK